MTGADRQLLEAVEDIRRIPYGRPSDRSVAAMLSEGRGTCSTKHAHLFEILAERFPGTDARIVHRVYRLSRADAAGRFGPGVAAVVPQDGLVDVHRYLECSVGDRRITLDVTFPGEPWDGRSSLPLACGEGDDYPAGRDPGGEKRALEERFCDPRVREPFIAALAAAATAPRGRRAAPGPRR